MKTQLLLLISLHSDHRSDGKLYNSHFEQVLKDDQLLGPCSATLGHCSEDLPHDLGWETLFP